MAHPVCPSLSLAILLLLAAVGCAGADNGPPSVRVPADPGSSIVVIVSPRVARVGDEVEVTIRNEGAQAVTLSNFLAVRDATGVLHFFLSSEDPNDSIEVIPGEPTPFPASGGPLESGAIRDSAVVVPSIAPGDYTLAPIIGGSEREEVVSPGRVTVVP